MINIHHVSENVGSVTVLDSEFTQKLASKNVSWMYKHSKMTSKSSVQFHFTHCSSICDLRVKTVAFGGYSA